MGPGCRTGTPCAARDGWAHAGGPARPALKRCSPEGAPPHRQLQVGLRLIEAAPLGGSGARPRVPRSARACAHGLPRQGSASRSSSQEAGCALGAVSPCAGPGTGPAWAACSLSFCCSSVLGGLLVGGAMAPGCPDRPVWGGSAPGSSWPPRSGAGGAISVPLVTWHRAPGGCKSSTAQHGQLRWL